MDRQQFEDKDEQIDSLISTMRPYIIRGFLTGKLEWAVVILILFLLIQSYRMPTSRSSANSITGSTIVATQLWKFTTDGSVYISPIVADGYIYLVSSFEAGPSVGYVYCLNASTGNQVWNYTVEGYLYSALAVSRSYVYRGSSRGKAYALNASTGTQIWNFTTGYIRGLWSFPSTRSRLAQYWIPSVSLKCLGILTS